MSLEEKTRQILNEFENTSSDQIVQTINEIMGHFRSTLTREYLQGKIDQIVKTTDEAEKKKLCKNLTPYLDWYLQGL